MCPERHLLSAFVDGEVPSPWDGRIEAHLESCERCRATVERYRAMRAALSGDSPAGADRMRDEIWARLAAGHSRRRADLWHRRVAVPLPLAMAAGVVVTVLATLLVAKAGDQGPARYESVATNQALISSQPVSFGSPGFVVSPFDQDGNQLTITIELPKQIEFSSEGQPVFVRGGSGQ
jgi:anti-sigma factor RsiW